MLQTELAATARRPTIRRIAVAAANFATLEDAIGGLERGGADVTHVALAELETLPVAWFDVVLVRLGASDTVPATLARIAEQERVILLLEDVSLDEPPLPGADFVLAPFRPAEVSRRVLRLMGQARPMRRLVAGDVELDTVQRTVTVAGVIVACSSAELQLLRALMEADGRVLTRAELGHTTGDDDERGYNLRIHRLRAKLATSERVRIETVRTVGYRLTVQPALDAAHPRRARH